MNTANPRQDHSSDLYSQIYVTTHGEPLSYAIHLVRDYVGIPRVTARSGLRELHDKISAVSTKLDELYLAAYTVQDWHTLTTIVTLWLYICPDPILCRKLVQRGVTSKALQLLGTAQAVDPCTRRRTLHLVSMLSRYEDEPGVKMSLRKGNLALKTFRRFPSDPRMRDFAIATVAHSVDVEIRDYDLATGWPETITSALADPFAAHDELRHAIPILIYFAHGRSSHEMEKLPGITAFFAALSRSYDITLRCLSMWTLVGIPSLFDNMPTSFVLTPERLPPHLRRTLEEYGMDRCDSILMERFMRKLSPILRDLVKYHDLYKFGTVMAEHLVLSQYVCRYKYLPKFPVKGLPYETWKHALPAAAKVLRERGDAAHLDMADILDLEFMISCSTDPNEKLSLARAVIARNPRHGFARMVFCLEAQDREEAIRVAEEGLELCRDASPYIRRQLLRHLAQDNTQKGWFLLLGASLSDVERRSAGASCLEAVARYAGMFISEAPPDAEYLVHVLDLYLVNMLILRGSALSENLSELQPYLDRREAAQNILSYTYNNERAEPRMTQAHTMIRREYSNGIKRYADVISRLDSLQADTAQPTSSLTRDIHAICWTNWWSSPKPSLTSIVRGEVICRCRSNGCRRTDPGPRMYHCSKCAQASAMVRRCSGCHNAWYCDTKCQRAHWEEHKKKCRSS
ncbi:hypothetical protein C8Q80DRAFT_756778 [Daedaleopsis nitida]|nr:hypothetical protein C8Q80DRAFT_756778 [Daedaleopsis nitida]